MTLLCPDCFGDTGLKSRLVEIRPNVGEGKCAFHPTKKGIPAAAVAEIVDDVFRQYYDIGEFESWNDCQAGDPLEYVICEFTEAEEGADEALAEALFDLILPYDISDGHDAFYASDQTYVRMDYSRYHYQHSQLWNQFCESILYSQRFFNDEAFECLQEIFDGIQDQKDQNLNPPVRRLKTTDVNNTFWRARIANDRNERKIIRENLALELGAPPKRLRRPGRMNSSGIQAFYGAFDFETCKSEIRPIVGSIIVAASFNLNRDIYVLDLTRFTAPIKDASVFNKSYQQRVEQWGFMRQFMEEVGKPISPDDTHLDYIPTQAVAEYLVYEHEFKRDGKDVKIEGIIFRSAQNPDGTNIVLFGDAAKCLLSETEAKALKKKETKFVRDLIGFGLGGAKGRVKQPGIKVDESSLIQHVVKGAKFKTIGYADYSDELFLDDVDEHDF